jgi:hypothetical protein
MTRTSKEMLYQGGFHREEALSSERTPELAIFAQTQLQNIIYALKALFA